MAIVCEEIPFSGFPSTYTALKLLILIHSPCFVSLMDLDSTSTGRLVTIGLPKILPKLLGGNNKIIINNTKIVRTIVYYMSLQIKN